MKIKNTVIICCIVFFYSLIPIQAQPVVAPGPDRVQELYDAIASCKKSIKELEIKIKDMQEQGETSKPEYIAAEAMIDYGEACVRLCRQDLDKLKKDYPEWFNQSGATIDLGDKHGNKAPWELEKEAQNLMIALVRIRRGLAEFKPY